jgi:hypothetical protein
MYGNDEIDGHIDGCRVPEQLEQQDDAIQPEPALENTLDPAKDAVDDPDLRSGNQRPLLQAVQARRGIGMRLELGDDASGNEGVIEAETNNVSDTEGRPNWAQRLRTLNYADE